MNKISKNIKTLRARRNLTQEALAAQIGVTRQAVSNWETGKSLPDIASLELLAKALDADIEEIIYGKSREQISENGNSREKNRIKIILAATGSVFIGVGLVLLFYNFWNEFNTAFKTVFSLLPMLCGQAVGTFAYFKKKESASFREGAGILWVIGVISTVALINSVYEMNLGYYNCLLIDAVLILPVSIVLNTVSPFAVYIFMSVSLAGKSTLGFLIISLVLFAAGAVICAVVAKSARDARGKFVQWVTFAASAALPAVCIPALSALGITYDCVFVYAVFLFTYFLCACILSKSSAGFSLPYRPVAVTGMILAAAFFALPENEIIMFPVSELTLSAVLTAAVCLVPPAVAAVIKREDFSEDIYSAVFYLAGYLMSASCLALAFAKIYVPDETETALRALWVLRFIFAAVMCAALVLRGVKTLRLSAVNLGLAGVFVQIMAAYLYLFDFAGEVVSLGLMFLVFGASVTAVNKKLLSDRKNSLAETQNGGNEDA